MGHPQPATPMKADNSTATGIINKTIKQKRSKAIDMHFYWLCDRVTQGMFKVYWEPGYNNLADYPTKHHSGTHHKAVRGVYLYNKDSPRTVKGCIEFYPLIPLGLSRKGLDWIFPYPRKVFAYPTRNREKHSPRDNLD